MPPKDKIVSPIDAPFEDVVQKLVQPAGGKLNKNNPLTGKMALQPAPQKQYVLDLGVEVQKEINGVEMGVLENGIPFLSQKGLAKVAGVARSVIFDISQDWEEHFDDPVITKNRLSYLKEYLFAKGYKEPKLYIETVKEGSVNHAYPDVVCMAILEYYSFESKGATNPADPKGTANVALQNYRRLATYGLQKFIYDALKYTPSDPWKMYHARVSLLQGSAPVGYFIVFHEIAPMIVDLINGGLTVNDHTVPDGSVGGCWGRYWEENALDSDFSSRIKYAHFYPAEFPQSKSNPQMAWAYPDAALPAFRKWFREEYLITKFPKYMLTKANVLGGPEKAKQIGNMYQPKQIGGN
jgi:hypothetical protein